ncbi:MAG: amidohydrolase family protein, partial [Ilumatobacteraceae bacterium]
FAIERDAQDFFITSIFEKIFDSFPRLRMSSVENGSDFLADAMKKMTSTAKKMPGYFSDDPIETFRNHWWINPFWEDDVHTVAELMGTDRVLFGSDWPHIEGMPNPLDYLPELKAFDEADRRRILHDNVEALNTRLP